MSFIFFCHYYYLHFAKIKIKGFIVCLLLIRYCVLAVLSSKLLKKLKQINTKVKVPIKAVCKILLNQFSI